MRVIEIIRAVNRLQDGRKATEKMEFNAGSNPSPSVNMTWEERAKALWSLLDNIDTAEDFFKPNDLAGYKRYYKYVHTEHQKRFEILTSDGYELSVPQLLEPLDSDGKGSKFRISN